MSSMVVAVMMMIMMMMIMIMMMMMMMMIIIIIIIIVVVIKSIGPNDCRTNKHPTVAKSSNQGILIFKSGPQHATSLGFGSGVGFTLT